MAPGKNGGYYNEFRENNERCVNGSGEALNIEVNGLNENVNKTREVSTKKRKFSPVVWDREDKEVSNVSESRVSVSGDVVQMSVLENDDFQKTETAVDVGSRDSNGFEHRAEMGLFSSSAQEENIVNVEYAGKLDDDEDNVPSRCIRSSRWANDADSPVNEDEESDALGNNGSQRMPITRSGSAPLGSERSRSRSSESNENGYHSDEYLEKDLVRKDYIEIDEDDSSDGPGVSQSFTDSESDDSSQGTPRRVLPPQRSANMLLGCRSVDEFERLNKIDEGTYGVVYRAKDRKTGEVVALKKVKMEREREGFPLTSLREINILLSFDHPSVVDVKEVVVGSNLDSIFMVMEYMEHDLKALMETMKQPFSQSEVKCLMLQLLEGTKYLHDNWVLHRDLKTSNLLLNNRGELKICDFGLSRQYGIPLKPYTHLVVTLWYRAPELLLGSKQYSTAIDMWSLGCIMAELLSKQPLFNGKTEFDQLDKIFKILGTPNEKIWPGLSKLPGVKLNFVKHQYNLLRRKFPATSFTGSPVLSDAGFDLLNRLLTYNPEKRITAQEALNHEWFREVPLPKSKDFMPTFPAHHAHDRRVGRVMKSPDPLEEQRRKELQQANLGTGGLFG
ncbi:Protein kinase, catalytic domain-containing protein [Artemisia annua]|uniref:cyclin-dependent kinase n=1 Tax=Artemisia annua TaxID=35608 RepID=A0A2U1QEK8_ARTAN|nr:Protein kinase, catalytic domain-containing protein [Artemisia annua]